MLQCVLQCMWQCVAVCVAVYVAVCCSVCCSVCGSVLQCVLQYSKDLVSNGVVCPHLSMSMSTREKYVDTFCVCVK